mmetsp:Transcript_9343/g.22929  ORF Transcript_9343/g.22929 Transcript_9343/m.22929 type:complete len:266 (-) Transcript_9343:388-1185(-)
MGRQAPEAGRPPPTPLPPESGGDGDERRGDSARGGQRGREEGGAGLAAGVCEHACDAVLGRMPEEGTPADRGGCEPDRVPARVIPRASAGTGVGAPGPPGWPQGVRAPAERQPGAVDCLCRRSGAWRLRGLSGLDQRRQRPSDGHACGRDSPCVCPSRHPRGVAGQKPGGVGAGDEAPPRQARLGAGCGALRRPHLPPGCHLFHGRPRVSLYDPHRCAPGGLSPRNRVPRRDHDKVIAGGCGPGGKGGRGRHRGEHRASGCCCLS